MECKAGQCNKISTPYSIFIVTALLEVWPIPLKYFWNNFERFLKSRDITICKHPHYPQKRWWLVDIPCKSGYSCVLGIDRTLWFDLLMILLLQKNLWISGLFRFARVDIFSISMVIMKLKFRTCWFLDRNLTFLTK